MKKTKVTISLLTWNGAQYIPWLIKSLKAQSFTNWKLLVLDNASTDNSADLVAEYCPQAKIIKKTKNIGFARGHNLLINWSTSDYVLVINQDVILDPDWLKETVNFLDKNPNVASCSGKIMYWDFNEVNKSKIIDSFGLKLDRKREAKDLYQGKKDFLIENTEVFGLSGAVTLYRRKALDIVGIPQPDNHFEYFDEDFFAYKEDIDLAWRLRLAGWENWLVSSTKAYHHRTVSGGKDYRLIRKSRAMANKMSYRNHLMMVYKNSFIKNLVKDFFQIKWYEFRKLVYLLLFERSTLVGLGEYFKLLPKLRKKKQFMKSRCQITARDMYQWFK